MTDETTEPAVDDETEPEASPFEAPAGADEPEPEPEDEPEDELEPEPDTAPSSNAIVKALEKEEGRHRRALAKALDLDESELHECPTCEAMGYTPEPLEAEPELAQDPYYERCDRCHGLGEVLTGAARSALWKVPCAGCGGSGAVKRPEEPGVPVAPGNGAMLEPTAAPPAPPSSEDAAHVADLRARGYMVVEPVTVPPTPAA